MEIFGEFLEIFKEFQRDSEILGYFWRVFRDIEGFLESFGESQRFLEIFGDFW